MLTTKELAKHMKVSPQTIWRWRASGMPYYKLSTRTIRYDLKEVLNWFDNERESVK